MKDFHNNSADNYFERVQWRQFYLLTEHWVSDLKFHRDEIRFLNHLIHKYILWLTRFEEVEMVRNAEEMLAKVQIECLELLRKTEVHLTHLANLKENPFSHDSQSVLDEHGTLEQALADFAKHFRNAKQEAFMVTENLTDSPEVAEHL